MKRKQRMIEAFCPTRAFIAGLQVGDKAPNAFGQWREVVEIFARREDISGRLFVCYYTDFGRFAGRLSGSLKENELHRSVPLTSRYTSAQLDVMEMTMQNNHQEVKVA